MRIFVVQVTIFKGGYMLIEQTMENLRALKLTGMAKALANQIAQPKSYDLSFEERLSLLVDEEHLERKNKRLERLLKEAKLRHDACIEDVDYAPQRGINKSQISSLLNCQWLKEGFNILITGSTGTGKSWLACALGQQACRQGLSVLYIRFTKLLEKIKLARVDGSYTKLLKNLSKVDLLILDDWLLEHLDRNYRHDILEIIEDRHGLKSIILTSQVPIQSWHEMVGDAGVADAILDRLLSKSIKLELKGESMRQKAKKYDAS